MNTKTKIIDLTKILKPYMKASLWVALDDNHEKVVGSGKTIREAIEESRRNGNNNPFILKAQENYSGFAPNTFI